MPNGMNKNKTLRNKNKKNKNGGGKNKTLRNKNKNKVEGGKRRTRRSNSCHKRRN